MTKNTFLQKPLLSFKSVFMLLVFLVSSFLVQAQEVQIEVKVDKTNILIGDQISLRNKISFNPQKFRIQLAELADTFNQFELVSRIKIDTANGKDQIILTQENLLTHFDSGTWVIPSQKFVVTPLDGSATYEILTDSFPIQVNTIDADTSKPIKPIYDIIAAKKPWWEAWLYWGSALLGLLLVLGFIYYYYKRNKNSIKLPKKEKKVYIAPWDAAADALQKLRDKELWLSGQEKQHHTRLTDIIRTYLEDAFGLDCFEKTSQEIITDVKKSLQKKKYKKRGEELDKLKNIFWTADLVKFAKSKPSELEHQKSNEDAISFVNNTSAFLQKETKELKSKS